MDDGSLARDPLGMKKELEPVSALAARNPIRHPGESAEYRAARQRLLEREYELRRLTEAVAEERRALPEGPEVKDYAFVGERGPVKLSDLFGAHDTLIVYSFMFGPQRKHPCPMCTSFLASSAPRVRSLEKNAAIAFTARSPIERIVAEKKLLGFPDLPVFSDSDGAFTREWVSADDADVPGLNVFVKKAGKLRHFWAGEMTESDPGQDPRGAPEIDPVWAYLDMTPEGRKPKWYPKLEEFGLEDK